MILRTPDLNGFLLFGLVPWIMVSGLGIAAYGILVAILLINSRLFTIAIVVSSALFAYLLLHYSPQTTFLSPTQINNSYNTNFAWLLVLVSAFASSRIPLRANLLTDVSLWIFLVYTIARNFFHDGYDGILQIASYTVALYMLFADTRQRKIISVLFVALSGARTITASFILALFLNRFRQLRAALSTPILIALIIAIVTGSVVAVGYDFLIGLREQHIFLEGRTNFWIALIETNPGLLGHGAGEALLKVEEVLGRYQLPHNDWLRLYTDFGLIGVLLTLASIFLSFSRNDTARFATIILAFYMITGNPLSFPTVIVSFFVVCRAYKVPHNVDEGDSNRRLRHNYHKPAGDLKFGRQI